MMQTADTRSVLLREDVPSTPVRVLPGFAVQARDDHAPTVPVMFLAGEEIPNLATDEALVLIALGTVEEVA
jgi:hypothetical protein